MLAVSKESFKQVQKDMGVSNDALSRLLGVSLATIEKRRSGAVKVTKETMMAMAYLKGGRYDR